MKRVMLVLLVVLAAAAAAEAQSNEEIIARAVLAAPGRAQEGAGVVNWDADGNRVMLKESENGFVCWYRSGQFGQRPFSVQCTNVGNIERYEQNREFFKAGGDRDGWNALMAEAEENGTRKVAVFGSIYYYMSGDDQESAGQHLVIAVPFATAESIGIPAGRTGGAVSIMGAGTSGAHLMIAGR